MARSDWKRPALKPVPLGYRRVKLTVSYDGNAFNGWQCQDNGFGVQNLLNEVLSHIYKSRVAVVGSGRTDSGVHALMQVCHYDVPDTATLPDEKAADALNTMLPYTVKALKSESADAFFHARFTTMAREYRYFVKAKKDCLPFDKGYVGQYKALPPLDLLQSYAALLAGTHDFTAFACAKDPCESKMRDIYESAWSEMTDRAGFPLYCYKVTGNAFLYHQVRSMVGTMMQMALAGRSTEDFAIVLESKDRSRAGTTAPASGLYLARVSYDTEEYRWFEEEHCGT